MEDNKKIEFEAYLIASRDQTAYDAPMVAVLEVDDCTELPEAHAWQESQLYRVTLEPIEPELRPCPFCEDGGTLDIECNGGIHYVVCHFCGAAGPDGSERWEAANLWNTRVKD